MFKLTPVTSKIGQGHPSSNLTKTLLRYIHGISFGSMRLIFVEFIVFYKRNVDGTDGRTDRQTDGRTDRQTDRRTDQSNSRVGYTQPNLTDGQTDRRTDQSNSRVGYTQPAQLTIIGPQCENNVHVCTHILHTYTAYINNTGLIFAAEFLLLMAKTKQLPTNVNYKFWLNIVHQKYKISIFTN